MDLLRGWNERSFTGWKPWTLRVAGIGAIASVLQSVWSPTPFSLYLVTVWMLGLAALLLALGQLIAWAGKISPRAALARLIRYAPIIWIVPIVDALTLAWSLRPEGSVWWIAPSGFLMRFFLAGCDLKGCYSPGLMLLGLLIPIALGWLMVKFGWTISKAIGLALGSYVLFWMILSVPSFTAWTRLSTYGTTLAPANQVVEQAFNRAWAPSIWSTDRESFWTVATTGNQSGRILIGSIFLWLLCFGLLAPLLGRTDTSKASWIKRLHAGTFILPPLLLGAFLGFRPLLTGYWLSSLISFIFYCAVVIVAWKAMMLVDDPSDDEEMRWLTIVFSLLGTWLLGWPTACAFAAALLIRWWASREGVTWTERVLSLASSSWLLMLASWTLFARTDWGSIPHASFFGLFAFLLGLTIWNEGAFSVKLTVVFGSFVVGLLILWLSTMALGLIWLVAAYAAVSAAILWLFPQTERNVALFSWFACIVGGILLHSFV